MCPSKPRWLVGELVGHALDVGPAVEWQYASWREHSQCPLSRLQGTQGGYPAIRVLAASRSAAGLPWPCACPDP
jgi:hypothetical protein